MARSKGGAKAKAKAADSAVARAVAKALNEREKKRTPKRSKGKKKNKMSRPPTRWARTHFWHPRNPGMVPTSEYEGHALAVNARVVAELALLTTSRLIYIFANVGRAGTVGMYFHDNGTTLATLAYTCPTLALADDAGGPTSGRAMKAALTLVNSTAGMSRAGNVTTLIADARILLPAAPTTMTRAQFGAWADTIKTHPRAVNTDAEKFKDGKRICMVPADNIEYHNYMMWQGTLSATEFAAHSCTWPGITYENARPMTALIIVFETPPANQSWRIISDNSFYTRYPLNTVTGQCMTPVPTAPLPTLNAHRAVAESALGSLEDVAEDTAIGASSLAMLGVAPEVGAALGLGYAAAAAMRAR